jgi:hypothetical protein
MSHPDNPFDEEPQAVDPIVRQSVELPATFILVLSILALALTTVGLFLSPAVFLSENNAAASELAAQFAGNVFVSLVQMAIYGLTAYSAWQMRSITSYAWSMAAAVIMCIPCIGPCCPFGIPVGIWAIVVLNKPEVKQAFEAGRPREY